MFIRNRAKCEIGAVVFILFAATSIFQLKRKKLLINLLYKFYKIKIQCFTLIQLCF